MPDPVLTGREVAIVGMAAVFPGAANLDAFWRNISNGVDSISDVPAARWDAEFYDPSAAGVDRFYCRRGGFIDGIQGFDPVSFGIMPVAAAGAEPDQLLALHVAAAAIADAGTTGREIARDRAAVILGRGGYLTSGMARLSNRVRTTQQVVTTLRELLPDLDPAMLERIRAAFQAKAGESGPDTAIGLVPNLAASRIANRLDLRGPAYTIDAACASSLIAVDQGCRELIDRRCDVVLAGGVHVCHDVTFWSVFTQLGALSRSQTIRPFDQRADGILIGEGCGILVLKRLADARRDSDRVYAVIHGTGVSSDGREASPMRPRLDGQLAALEAAWRRAGRDPEGVGLIEAHGTATPTGDGIELAALGQFFGAGDSRRPRAIVGSIKSMIGHAMPAAGAAGLIKTALAIHHGVLPPSLHCDEPHASLDRTRFRVLGSAEPWDTPVRRAGVSAFGFGGINAHVMLEGDGAPHGVRTSRRLRVANPASQPNDLSIEAPRLLALAANSTLELRALMDEWHPDGDPVVRAGVRGEGPVRLVLLDPTPERFQLARQVVERERPWRGTRDLWFTPRGLAALDGRIAFLYPGIEAAFAPRVADVAANFGLPLPSTLAEPANSPNPTPRELEQRSLGVFALGRLLTDALARQGVHPDVMAGHSIGEWTAMVTSEMVPPSSINAFMDGLPTGSLEIPDVVFAAVGCGATDAEAVLDDPGAIAISHDNCPHQSVLCGHRDAVTKALQKLGQRSVLCQELPFRSGFHSPLFTDYLAPHQRHIATLSLQRPWVSVWSATTCAPYPDDAHAVRALLVDHLVQPVRFRQLIDALYASGVRVFIQLGVGSLVGFVGDTLRGQEHVVIAASTARHTGLSQLARVVCALHVEGYPVDLTLIGHVAPPGPAVAKHMSLELGVPLVRLGDAAAALRLELNGSSSAPPVPRSSPAPDWLTRSEVDAGDPVVVEMLAMLNEATEASESIIKAYRSRGRERTIQRTLSADTVPALLDHCFYRQPDNHPTISDRYPVVPMTMTIAMMLDAARTLVPGRVAIAIEDVRAFRWLAVAPPAMIEIRARQVDDDSVDVEIPGYSRATVRMARHYPPAPAASLGPLAMPRPTPITAARLYADRWMFHGPRYAGVVGMGPMGNDGIDGVIEVLPSAPGELLDCAGQLMGWWIMNHETRDRLAMPVRIERIQFFADEPIVAEMVHCGVRIRHIGERDVRADLELVRNGTVWAHIDGWEDRRFDSDDVVWAVLHYPEHNALAEPRPGGWVLVTEHCRTAASRELLMRRYLGENERADFDSQGPRGKRAWLLGRIAAKDAVRRRAWESGASTVFPVEVEVGNEASGAPIVGGRHAAGLRVSISHKDDVAVAIIGVGMDVGIDIERITPRSESLGDVAFTQAELALGSGRPHEEWVVRLWTAKEAMAKACRTGMTNPRRFEVVRVDGDDLTINGTIVHTTREGDHIIAWTRLTGGST